MISMGSNISPLPLELPPWSMWESSLTIFHLMAVRLVPLLWLLPTGHWNFTSQMLSIRLPIHRLCNFLGCFPLDRVVARRSVRVHVAQQRLFRYSVLRMVETEYTQSSWLSPHSKNEQLVMHWRSGKEPCQPSDAGWVGRSTSCLEELYGQPPSSPILESPESSTGKVQVSLVNYMC